jgi:hypothetical protein
MNLPILRILSSGDRWQMPMYFASSALLSSGVPRSPVSMPSSWSRGSRRLRMPETDLVWVSCWAQNETHQRVYDRHPSDVSEEYRCPHRSVLPCFDVIW